MIISLINQKGGVGKTTSAMSIASYLGKTNKVLLIDSDSQGNATTNSGVNKVLLKKTIKNLLLDDDTTAEECIVSTEKGFDLIGSNLEVADTEMNLINKFSREFILKNKIQNLEYDYVIIDCPPTLSLMTVNALLCSDLALTPLEAHIYAVEGIESLMKTINVVKQVNKTLKHNFFITKFDARMKKYKEIENNLRTALSSNILNTKIRTDNNIRNAQNDYKTIWENGNTKATEDYKNLISEVL